MPIKQYRPTSPGRRGMSVSTFEEITKTKPEKSLTVRLKKHSGRNNQGKITVRHRGGGAKRAYRLIDFKRNKLGVPAKVAAIEYDPNRSARIALLHYLDGEKRYILAPVGLKVGDRVVAGPEADIQAGQRAAPEKHPDRYHHSQRRADTRARRPVGARRGRGRAVDGERGRLCPASPAIGRAAPRAYHVHGYHWTGGQRRSREPDHRQGRTLASYGPPPNCARLRDEPARPSTRWW